MRIVEEPVPVTLGRVDGVEAPGRFRWRQRWWQVVRIQARWIRTAEWWDGPAARALRGESVAPEELEGPLCPETVFWRVEARIVGQGRIGVFELAARDERWDVVRIFD